MSNPDSQIGVLDEKMSHRSKLIEITNQIHSAQNIKQILVGLGDTILGLFNAQAITMYAVDRHKNQIYSKFLTGSELAEIRVNISNTSIAGFVANNKVTINVADAYDITELQQIDQQLQNDQRWDQKTGFRTRQVLAIPILHNAVLMGVIQIINRKGGGKFTEAEQDSLQEIASVLGVAFYNQERLDKKRKSPFDYLIHNDFLTEEVLESAWERAKREKVPLETHLVKKLGIPQDEVIRSYEEFYQCKLIRYDERIPIPTQLLDSLNPEYLKREVWVPLGKEGDTIRILIDDPNNVLKRDMIETFFRTTKIKYDIALPDDIKLFINQFFRTRDNSSIDDIIGKMDSESDDLEDEVDGINESDSVIMQLVNTIINDAYVRRASDIHIEPNVGKKNVEVRFRIDGDCMIYQTIPYSYRNAILSRIKVMANLDITERRKPQDGKIQFTRSNGLNIELRIATLPTVGGVEDVVMRILAKGGAMPLSGVGMLQRNQKEMENIAKKPYGMILVVGPTGSGKTTTLHAVLNHINKPDRKIWTAEDPVEITQYGLRQVQVQPRIGFDFASAMRSFLRADPDVIMVGEMRDLETAKTGIEASLTGHLVLSTLHTNNAPETIVRLLDMGIDPLNFADSLLGILGQRLVKRLCKHCREEYHPNAAEFDEIVNLFGKKWWERQNIEYSSDFKLYRPKGCTECDNIGYRGRMGIHELLINSEEIKKLIRKRETNEVISDIAMEEGMTTLLQDGIFKSFTGETDIEQVRKVCVR